MRLRPVRDLVIVQREEAKDRSDGGILLPDGAKEKPRRGTILAVGPGRMTDDGVLVPMSVEVGDVVLYTRYGGNEVEDDGETYLILSQSEILATL